MGTVGDVNIECNGEEEDENEGIDVSNKAEFVVDDDDIEEG